MQMKTIVYDTWENDKYIFRFSRTNGYGFLSVYKKESRKLIEHTICADLKMAKAEATHYWV